VYWLEVLNGVRFYFTGLELGRSTDTAAIIICNHPTESDMPFFWHIPYRLGLVGDVKFVTKAAVRKVPILGCVHGDACTLCFEEGGTLVRPAEMVTVG
jgi:1-acyl-sn-glycerol-3-phosphate acyltransferase